jgi:dTDP-4-amino-4,6-dideoxygalactose transaminase
MALSSIPFSKPYLSRAELGNVQAVLESGHVHGDGRFTASATRRLAAITGAKSLLTTSSCTHALEMASLLIDLGPGDEVIMPSFTFPSAATAIVASRATPVFVDIEPVHGNIDVRGVEPAITERTRAISVLHYGGVGADMAFIMDIARKYDLRVIEDNAHGLGGMIDGRQLGSFGALATQSFHDTKNVHSGEGGALLINDLELSERAEIIREKGTDRSRFLRGQVDKYTWTDAGSSYLMSELNAAVLDSQLAQFEEIQSMRHQIWDRYALELSDWASAIGARLMNVPEGRSHTAHMFFVVMPDHQAQLALLDLTRSQQITATFHYVPLDSSPAGLRFGITPEPCDASFTFSRRLVRLPLWAGMSDAQVSRVVDVVRSYDGAGRVG